VRCVQIYRRVQRRPQGEEGVVGMVGLGEGGGEEEGVGWEAGWGGGGNPAGGVVVRAEELGTKGRGWIVSGQVERRVLTAGGRASWTRGFLRIEKV
jgi:hypothetical protein